MPEGPASAALIPTSHSVHGHDPHTVACDKVTLEALAESHVAHAPVRQGFVIGSTCRGPSGSANRLHGEWGMRCVSWWPEKKCQPGPLRWTTSILVRDQESAEVKRLEVEGGKTRKLQRKPLFWPLCNGPMIQDLALWLGMRGRRLWTQFHTRRQNVSSKSRSNAIHI